MWLGGSPLPEHEKVIRGYLNHIKVPVPKKARERERGIKSRLLHLSLFAFAYFSLHCCSFASQGLGGLICGVESRGKHWGLRDTHVTFGVNSAGVGKSRADEVHFGMFGAHNFFAIDPKRTV